MLKRIFLISIILCIFAFHLLSAKNGENETILSRQKRVLVFPQYTVVQLAMCIISQISYIPSHKVAVNTGFMMSYGLPYNTSNFWSPVYWARSLLTTDSSSSVLYTYLKRLSESGDDFSLNFKEEQNEDNAQLKINDDDEITTTTSQDEELTTLPSTTEKSKKNKKNSKTKRDVSASEFYAGIKETLSFAGYHQDCLLKSICELAKHPLEMSTDENFIYDIVHFILTPSLHKAFDAETEKYDQEIFEAAEKLGESDGDCDLMYQACNISPLHSISNFIETEVYE
ncbi:hypothetical protein PVAND_008987 [Polypedilum vanderplanki]|uniref:Uncharacterized protein n=1 Tax=Polypedilum vanderplanki TaxID=319348 RepID=A0A9J6CBB4_POLVA|nr:hypothetical protein PVAND_008987 [Polypedilum vanderplanki]